MRQLFNVLVLIIGFISSNTLFAQDPYIAAKYNLDYNFLVERVYQVETPLGEINFAGDVMDKVYYFDGLARIVETRSVQGSPSKKDIVQIYEYDINGRTTNFPFPYYAADS